MTKTIEEELMKLINIRAELMDGRCLLYYCVLFLTASFKENSVTSFEFTSFGYLMYDTRISAVNFQTP